MGAGKVTDGAVSRQDQITQSDTFGFYPSVTGKDWKVLSKGVNTVQFAV
jgi:hypothetical protein